MAGIFERLLQVAAKYGPRVVSWIRANAGTIFKWIGEGQAIEWIIQKIKQILHIR